MDLLPIAVYICGMVQTYDTFWQKLYGRRLGEAAERESERIVTGNAQDFADYKFQAGIIRGLNIAHELIGEVNAEISKAEQGEK